MIALKIQLADIEAEMKRHEADVVLQDSKNRADDASTNQTGINTPISGHRLPKAGTSHKNLQSLRKERRITVVLGIMCRLQQVINKMLSSFGYQKEWENGYSR